MTNHPQLAVSSTAAGLVLAALVFPGATLGANDDANWPQWRGPAATGAAAVGDPPTEWSETKNVRWKAKIGGLGSSSPIVWGDLVFVTTAVDTGKKARSGVDTRPEGERQANPAGAPPQEIYRFEVVAYRRSDGSEAWRTAVAEEQPHEGRHPTGTFASGSPVTDGERLYVSFGSRGIFALDLEGRVLWQKDLGDMTTRYGFGEGASPTLHGDLLVVNWDHQGESFIVALDKATGEERWRVDRDEETSWTTPLVVDFEGRSQVITSATSRIRSYDLRTGELIWHATGMTLNAIPSPIYEDGVVYLTSGFRGNSMQAIELAGAEGDITGTDHIKWSLDRDTPYVPSALLYEDRIYFLKSNNGVLSVVDARSGRVLYGPERLGSVRNVYASPVAVADRVYFLGRQGEAAVIRHGDTFEVLAENQLDDAFDASPALAGDEIYLRGAESLYCIAAAD
jgi:outer membrane protein assembly factor BamB